MGFTKPLLFLTVMPLSCDPRSLGSPVQAEDICKTRSPGPLHGPATNLSLVSTWCPILGDLPLAPIAVWGVWHVLISEVLHGGWGQEPPVLGACTCLWVQPPPHTAPRGPTARLLSCQVWGDGAGLPKDKEHSVCFICRLALTRNRIPTVTASRKRLRAGGSLRESRPLPSKPLQVGFQEGPPPAPLSPGKGPTMSPGEGGGGERRGEERGGKERKRKWVGSLPEPAWLQQPEGRPELTTTPSRTFCSPFWRFIQS